MIGDSAHKEILKEDYKKHRKLADDFREKDSSKQAASHYRECVDILTQMAELESSETLANQRQELADNLSEAADKLERVADSTPEDAKSEDTPRTEESELSPEQTQPSKDDSDEEVDPTSYLKEPPDLDFDDVGGMTDLKQDLIDKVVDPLDRPDLYEEYDLGVVNGVLLYGPPGTGKTYITRALAGKLEYNFIPITPSDLTSSLVGEAADNVAELFDVAREHQPCLVFIDEIDAIAGQRSGGAQKSQSERQIVNQLLTELSEIQGEDIVVFAATNLLDAVDDAIKRSGRFDERIEVPPPDPTAREAILRVHLRNRPVLTDKINWEKIVSHTEGYAASDLELTATTAARKALKEAQVSDEIQPVEQSHLEAALEDVEPSLSD